MSRSAWATRLATNRSATIRGAVVAACLLMGGLQVRSAAAQDPPVTPEAAPAADEPDPETAKRYEEFSKRLSGSTMQGFFSVDGQAGDLKEDRYEIKSVTKIPTGDLWMFNVRIRYGDHDVTAPLPLTVSWAGKTPVIVVDRLTIPGLGTFDARVVIADQRYAGTWQHGDVGGHLFGKIEPAGAAPNEAPEATEGAPGEAKADEGPAEP